MRAPSVASADPVRPDPHVEVEVAGRPARRLAALAGEADASAVCDARWDPHREVFLLHAAVGRGAPHRHALLPTAGRIDEVEGDRGVEVGAAPRARRPLGASEAGEHAAEEIVQVAVVELAPDVAFAACLAEARPEGLPASTGRLGIEAACERGVSELVVLAALLGLGEHRVGLGDLLEPLLRRRVARVQVGVVLARQLPVGLPDGLGVGVARYTHRFVEVLHRVRTRTSGR
jgi:hypothetical protein